MTDLKKIKHQSIATDMDSGLIAAQPQSTLPATTSPPTAAANTIPTTTIISSTDYNSYRSSQDDVPTCRICHCAESPTSSGFVKLISPCHCSGSLKYVHHGCLQQWLDATNSQRCELCRHPFSMSVKYKPLYKWSSLNTSPGERRKLICNSVFNLVSMICIFWSIYVLIERAALDAHNGQIDWSFYVKISVVTIGLIIGVIFLFVQLKLYFSIFMKWRQSNRIIIIRDASFAALAATRTATPTTNTASTTTNNTSNNEACSVIVCT